MEELILDDVTIGYGEVPVVHGVSLTVNAGEIVCLLGPNGAGKTTTLLAASRLLPVMGGSITYAGVDTAKLSPDALTRSGLVQVPEDRSLFKTLTVRENLEVATRDPGELERVLSYFPALVRISDRQASVLSGGEQQMLALARALALKPKILLIDEMSLGLAPLIVESIFDVLKAIAESTGCAVLMVEQHVRLALEVADRALVMVRGRIVREGSAVTIADSLTQLRADYLGFHGEAADDGPTPDIEGDHE